MPLDPKQRERIEAEAKKRGIAPAAAIAHAEKLTASRGKAPMSGGGSAPRVAVGAPTFERLLLGALPFMRVREFRKKWLGLDEPFPDEDMPCGAHMAKYGGAGSPATPDAEQPA